MPRVALFALVATLAATAPSARGQAEKVGRVAVVPEPRAGLSTVDSRDAVRIAGPAFKERAEKLPKAPDADPREYVVGVEMLVAKSVPGGPAGKASTRPRAAVTSYRYADDTTTVVVVDLETGKVVDVQSAPHLRTALSSEEYREAQALARDKSPEVRTLYEVVGPKATITVYPQYSQFTLPGQTKVHRIIQLTYRVDGRDLAAPRPVVDLTTREVRIPNVPAAEGR